MAGKVTWQAKRRVDASRLRACLATVFSACGVMLGPIRFGAPATTKYAGWLSEPLF